MYIAVCDDRTEDLNAIDALLCAWEKEQNLPLHRKLFSNAVELLDAARRENFTLYLLDVIVSGINGMSAARELLCARRRHRPPFTATICATI